MKKLSKDRSVYLKVDTYAYLASTVIRAIILFTIILVLIFLADYYNRLELVIINYLFIGAIIFTGARRIFKSVAKRGPA
jgi:hypothetical protein